MNTRAKGNRRERLAQDELEAAGYLVERARQVAVWTPAGMRSQHADILGAFDLAAFKPGERIRLVQVCEDGGAAERRRKIGALAPRLPLDHVALELWRFRGGQTKKGDRLPRGFIKQRYIGAGWILHVDHPAEEPDADRGLLGV